MLSCTALSTLRKSATSHEGQQTKRSDQDQDMSTLPPLTYPVDQPPSGAGGTFPNGCRRVTENPCKTGSFMWRSAAVHCDIPALSYGRRYVHICTWMTIKTASSREREGVARSYTTNMSISSLPLIWMPVAVVTMVFSPHAPLPRTMR